MDAKESVEREIKIHFFIGDGGGGGGSSDSSVPFFDYGPKEE